jgi:hypothetical protein
VNSVLRAIRNGNVILNETVTHFGIPEDIQELHRNFKIIEGFYRKKFDGSVVAFNQILKKNSSRKILILHNVFIFHLYHMNLESQHSKWLERTTLHFMQIYQNLIDL